MIQHACKILLPLFFLFFLGCNSNSNQEGITIIEYEDENEDLYNFEAFNLQPYGIDAIIYLPDATANIGAAVEPKVIHEMDGYEWEIILGQNFHMKIEDWGDTDAMANAISDLEDQNIYDIEYLKKESDFIYYKATLRNRGDAQGKEVGVEHISYHVVAQHEIDGINYLFMTNEDGHPKPITDYMAISVRNVEPIIEEAI